MNDFTTKRPTEPGWYDVIWEPGFEPLRVWISVSDDGLLWGWNESDDREAIELDIERPELIQFRKASQ